MLKRLTRGTKDAFWEVILDCLVDLCGVPPADARTLCNDRRAAVEFVPKSLRSNIYYHREPLDVALNLAKSVPACGNSLAPDPTDPLVAARYDAILARHGLI